MIPVQGFKGARVIVLGLGRTGRAAALALAEGGAEALCWDDNPAAREAAEADGLTVADLGRRESWDGVVALITSPGIPHLYPQPNKWIAEALDRGIPVDNDIGLFFRSLATPQWDKFEIAPKVIAVTGSNGKSTTAALIHHCLHAANRDSQLAGNIGRGVLDIDPPEDGGVVVLELSSYQTELARSLTPDVAVFTNLTPDHLDRHAGFGGYFAAKRRLFAEGGPDRAVVGVDEAEGRFLANQLSEAPSDDRVIRVSSGHKLDGPGWSVVARKGFLSETRKGRQIASVDLREVRGLPGAHNHQNACAAWGALRALGIAPRQIEAAFKTFKGLPHRSQIIAEANGVSYVNDSKATNVDSAAKALSAFKNIRWIVGGQMKDGGLDTLKSNLSGVTKAYIIGRQSEEIAVELADIPHTIAETMEAAVQQAAQEAVSGDTVLLAPACASFDQYDNFEKRGEDFIACVQQALNAQ